MSKTIKKNYEMKGFGFRVVLEQVELVPHGDDFYPLVDSRKLQDAVFDVLLHTPTQLLGAHLVFIRKYMSMTQTEFAQALGLNGHTTVSNWESAGHDVPKGLDSLYLAAIRAIMAKYRGQEVLKLADFTGAISRTLPPPEPAISIPA